MNMEESVVDALSKGWQLASQHPRQATFTFQGSRGIGVSGHALLAILTIISCGLGALIWIPVMISEAFTPGPQTLIITDTGTEITRRIVKS